MVESAARKIREPSRIGTEVGIAPLGGLSFAGVKGSQVMRTLATLNLQRETWQFCQLRASFKGE
jgi:hypothetical protein